LETSNRHKQIQRGPVLKLRDWLVPIAFLASLTVLIGLAAGPAFNFALLAGEQLMDPSFYIEAVLGVSE
jgi:multicomponent Na+:H+ antiporter subunit D